MTSAPVRFLITAAATLSVGACTCESVSSENVKTSGLLADFEATASGDGKTGVKATLRMSRTSLTFVELSGGDVLTASAGGAPVTMDRRRLLGSTWYEAELPTDIAGTVVRVAFTRAAETSAPESSVSLPASFTLTAPTENQSVSRAAGPLLVSWQGGGQSDELRLGASGSCIDTLTETVLPTDSGSHQLAAFTARKNQETSSCDVTVTLKRVRRGTVDPAFGLGGDFTASVVRQVRMTSTP
jgi:hypothetical protein